MRISGIRRLGLSAVIVIAAFLVVAFFSRPHNTAGPCKVTNRAMLPDAPEASGLAVSRGHPGLLWTHNDSGNDAVLFAIDASGAMRGQVRVKILMRDWEDISAAPCPSLGLRSGQVRDCLYLGDIGDNSINRRRIQVLVVAEPDPAAAETARPEIFNVAYPDGAHNAEAMFVVGGRLFIVTRDGGMLYGSDAPLRENHDLTLRRISSLGLGVVTDAEASPDEASVAVRTSHEVAIYRTADLIGGSVTPHVRISLDGLGEPQGEGVALADNGTLFLASEGRAWNRAGRIIMLRCNLTRDDTVQ
jgi:hypothetical protein